MKRTVSRHFYVLVLLGTMALPGAGRCAADSPPPLTREAIWADPGLVTVFEDNFESESAAALVPLRPAEFPTPARYSGIVADGEDHCCMADFDLPANSSQSLRLPMAETDPTGLHARFRLKVESDPEPAPGELALNIHPDVYYSLPLEGEWAKTGDWLAQTTALYWRRHVEYIHKGWVLYEGDTADLLRRRPADPPKFQGIDVTLINTAERAFCVKVYLDDVVVVRRDVLNTPELKAILNARRPIMTHTREQILHAREQLAKLGEEAMPAWVRGNLRTAEAWLDRPVEVPRRRAGYPTVYYCQQEGCGARIYPNPPPDFVCAKCGREHTGELYDGLLALRDHSDLSNAAEALGFAWQWTDDERYAQKAEEILLAFADVLPEIKPTWGHNWLGDVWLMYGVLAGYDYIYEWLSDESRRKIDEQLLMTEVSRIYHYNATHYPEGYVAVRKACAWATILARKPEWIHFLIFSPRGNREATFRYGFTGDMVSLKGAAYHGSIVVGLTQLGVTVENCGVRYFDSRFRAVFDALPNLCLPDASLPAFGHTNVGLGARSFGMDLAYTYYRDPIFLTLAPESFRTDPHLFSLRDDELPPVGPLRLPSTQMSALGVTILRTQPDNESVLALSWGEPQRNDPARLDFHLYGAGGHLLWGSGVTSYGNPFLEPWYHKSVSRNVVVVDEGTQAEVAGDCLLLDTDGPAQIVAAELRNAYPDTRLVRAAVLFEDGDCLLLDLFASPRPRTVDWVCQLPGEVETSAELQAIESPFGKENGYQVLEDVREGKAGGPVGLIVRHGERGVRLLHAPVAGTTLYLARGKTGHSVLASNLCLLRRRGVSRTVHAVLLQPFGDAAPRAGGVDIVKAEPAGDSLCFGTVEVEVQTATRRHVVMLRETPPAGAEAGTRPRVTVTVRPM